MNHSPAILSDRSGFDTAAARLTVDLGAIVSNWRLLSAGSGAARAAAALKADAYGVGAEPVGKALAAAGCRDFFVADTEEGRVLRRIAPDARIFVLNGIWNGSERDFSSHGLIPVINSGEQWRFLRTSASGLPHALHVDTGMNRLGLTMEDAASIAQSAPEKPVLVMSHLACADDRSHPMNQRQLDAFRQVTALFPGVEASLSSTGGILLGRDYHFDLTRPGIGLYGAGGGEPGTSGMLAPSVTAEARILQIRRVRQGETTSYGATHRFAQDARIAIVGAGYADGWPRAMSGSGVPGREDGSTGAYGFIAGQRVPIVGRVTMDLTIFDISAIAENRVAAGDYIELFGRNITIADTARAAGTIGYELLTSLGQRYARRFTGSVQGA